MLLLSHPMQARHCSRGFKLFRVDARYGGPNETIASRNQSEYFDLSRGQPMRSVIDTAWTRSLPDWSSPSPANVSRKGSSQKADTGGWTLLRRPDLVIQLWRWLRNGGLRRSLAEGVTRSHIDGRSPTSRIIWRQAWSYP